ncbi:amino acid permease [Cohnella pontilimi]|uniref:Amino acid permease n=1 Tax=Cohnella pontilimi TaxID=2564100 RepID=A0A4U0F2X7_9BACL|nr:amino acid permease [Cohnella pontilimi]
MSNHTSSKSNVQPAHHDKTMKWWHLSLLGVACTIGTGYFLGSGIGIRLTGPSILLSFLWAATATYLVFDALARMTAAEPMEGSFRSYAKKAFGPWAGFSSGWAYWSAETLITGSQMTALSLFSRFWFPNIPLWVFAAGYSALALVVILSGTKGFERVEHVFAALKLCAILLFLVLASGALLGWFDATKQPQTPAQAFAAPFPGGFTGWWSSLIYAFYSFGGIEVMGLMAMRLRHPKEAPKAGKVMLTALTALYLASLLLAVWLMSWQHLPEKKSPFVTSLANFRLPFVPHVFNGVFILSGFSTMIASLFAVTNIMVTLAKDKDAPPLFARTVWKRPLPAVAFTTAGMAASIVFSFVMPHSVYEYFTTAAGLMLLSNWLFILMSAGKILELSAWGQIKRWLGFFLILTGMVGTVSHSTSRPGFWISLSFLLTIGVITFILSRIRRRQRGGSGEKHPKRLNAEISAETDQRQTGEDRYRRKNPWGHEVPEYAGHSRHGEIPDHDSGDNAAAVIQQLSSFSNGGGLGEHGSVDAEPKQDR